MAGTTVTKRRRSISTRRPLQESGNKGNAVPRSKHSTYKRATKDGKDRKEFIVSSLPYQVKPNRPTHFSLPLKVAKMPSYRPRKSSRGNLENVQFHNQVPQARFPDALGYPPGAVNYQQIYVENVPHCYPQLQTGYNYPQPGYGHPRTAYQQPQLCVQANLHQQSTMQYRDLHQQVQSGCLQQGAQLRQIQGYQQASEQSLQPYTKFMPGPGLITTTTSTSVGDKKPGSDLKENYHQHEEALGRYDAALLVEANAAVDRGCGISLRTTMITLAKHANGELQDAEYRAASQPIKDAEARDTSGGDTEVRAAECGKVLDVGLSRRRKAMLGELIRYNRFTDSQLLSQLKAIRANLGSHQKTRVLHYGPTCPRGAP